MSGEEEKDLTKEIEETYNRLKELVKGDDRKFRKALDEMMNLDPWPGSLEEFVMFTALLDQQAEFRGFNSWIQAYHEFEVEKEKIEYPYLKQLHPCPVCGKYDIHGKDCCFNKSSNDDAYFGKEKDKCLLKEQLEIKDPLLGKEMEGEMIEEENIFVEKKLKVNEEEQKLGIRIYFITKEGRFYCNFCNEFDMKHDEHCLVGKMLKGMNL